MALRTQPTRTLKNTVTSKWLVGEVKNNGAEKTRKSGNKNSTSAGHDQNDGRGVKRLRENGLGNDYGRNEEELDVDGKRSEEGRGAGKIGFLNSRGGFRRSDEKTHH
jgi:hypothetical protein